MPTLHQPLHAPPHPPHPLPAPPCALSFAQFNQTYWLAVYLDKPTTGRFWLDVSDVDQSEDFMTPFLVRQGEKKTHCREHMSPSCVLYCVRTCTMACKYQHYQHSREQIPLLKANSEAHRYALNMPSLPPRPLVAHPRGPGHLHVQALLPRR